MEFGYYEAMVVRLKFIGSLNGSISISRIGSNFRADTGGVCAHFPHH